MLKSLRRGERLGTIGVVAGLLALVFVGVTLLGAVLWQASKFRDFRSTVADICTSQRVATEQVRQTQRQWFIDHQDQEASNRFIDGELRALRVDSDQRVIDAFDRALQVGMPKGCEAYRR